MIENKKIENTEHFQIQSFKPFVLTVTSGKGGVGKSVLSANIANKLAEKGLSVLLWDADMYFPNLHLIIGVEPILRASDVYSGNVNIEKAIYTVKENFDLLAETPANMDKERHGSSVIIKIFSEIMTYKNYDVVIIDTPAGISQDVLQCCEIADKVAITVTDEPTSLLDAYGLIKMLLANIDQDNINLLVNNVIDYDDADDISSKMNLATEKFLGIKLDVLGYVPYDRVVRQSILQQELFTNEKEESEIIKAIFNIAKEIDIQINTI